MKVSSTRFIISVMAILILGGLAFFAIYTKEGVTAPLCVTAIGGIAGYYTYGKTRNNDTYMQNQPNQNSEK